jgi:plastocyanin
MRIHRHAALAASILIIGTLVAVVACSKKTTNPGGGGGMELNSGNIAVSAIYVHTFNTQGLFNYKCTIHGFTGTVTVNGTAAAPAPVSIGNSAFSPANLTVGAGSTVTWTNNGTTIHTVTSF